LTTRIQAVRGMNDILPEETAVWQHVEDRAREVLEAYGYGEIRPPLIERTELFQRSIGEVTDIVEKEMYTFLDRSGDSLTLRPECTASMVRAAVEHSLLRGQVQRLWAIGPMFRYERPQKGRYRQFHQIDVEVFGAPGPEIDAELILLTARLWRRLDLSGLRLELNSLGTRPVQAAYRDHLVEYFSRHCQQLDDDSRRRLQSNPLRILDSKNPELQTLIEAAPKLIDHLDDESRAHFDELQAILEASGLSFCINPRLVRGLDYYTRTVFEWVTERLGAQGAVCGGGRYDNLVADIGGEPTPATGFAIGMERLVALLKTTGVQPAVRGPHVCLLALGREATQTGCSLAERLRERLPRLRLVVDGGEGSLRSKLRRADRSGARLALILGEDEVRERCASIKDLRGEAQQMRILQSELESYLEPLLPVDEESS
jgi:histidyl-tRNA synthetase